MTWIIVGEDLRMTKAFVRSLSMFNFNDIPLTGFCTESNPGIYACEKKEAKQSTVFRVLFVHRYDA